MREKCFLIKGFFIFVDEIQDNMLYCCILPITKCESLFKNPCNSKMLDIFKASRTSPFKRKMVDKDSIL